MFFFFPSHFLKISKVKQHWASSVLGWVTIWLGCSNPSIGTSFNFFFQHLKIFIKFSKIFNFYQNLKNLQFWPNFQISSIMTKIWIILSLIKFQLHWSNFQKSSIFPKIWKIFDFYQNFKYLQFSQILKNLQFFPNLKNLKFWPNFQKSSFLTKFSKMFNFDK